ncbi:mechanosensitive ion channel [Candidatus Woesearchaeota archaeon]|nr:mechanosensitive ion channel [Candidatus Woesearchaeota archaeon]
MASFIGEVSLERFVFFIVVIVMTIAVGNTLSAFIRKYFKLKGRKSWFYILLPKLVLYTIYAAGFYYATNEIIRFNVTAFAAAFGIIGIVVAFSSQQTIQNIIAGVILFFDRLIQEGEYIEFNNALCKVEDISLRKTKLRAVDGRLIVAPNSQFVTGTVVNYSKGHFYRITAQIPVGSESDIDKAKSILYQIAVDHAEIVPRIPLRKKSVIELMLNVPPNLQKFEPKVWVKELSKEKTVLEVWCWIGNIRAKERILTDFYQEAKKRLAEANIKLA